MASKKESTFVNMVIVLTIVAAVAATSLAYVNEFTKEPIAKAKLKKKKEAISKVVPQFDTTSNPIAEMYKVALSEGDSLECYPAKKNGELVGIAVKANTKLGFSGEFWLMVGFKPDGTIQNISVLEHRETPGLGDKMEKKKSDWSLQFNGKNPGLKEMKVTKDGGEIHAITASTISSRAFCDAVNRAYKAFSVKKTDNTKNNE